MDIELMRRLSPRVNVIPVIGKADSLTPKELKAFKKRVRGVFVHRKYHCLPSFLQIMEDIDYYEIPIYNFPYDVEEDDEETISDNIELRVRRSTPSLCRPLNSLYRQCFHSLSSALKRRSSWMASQSGQESTPGVSLRWITPIILTLLGSVALFLGTCHWYLSQGIVLMPSSSHLNDLKSLTEDVLYETYRTEKLSRSLNPDSR